MPKLTDFLSRPPGEGTAASQVQTQAVQRGEIDVKATGPLASWELVEDPASKWLRNSRDSADSGCILISTPAALPPVAEQTVPASVQPKDIASTAAANPSSLSSTSGAHAGISRLQQQHLRR